MTFKKKFIINSNISSFLVLVVLSFFMLGANPFKSETIAPMDLLLSYTGWQNTDIHPDYIHGERSDVLDAKLPIWISAKNDLYKGEIPQWNKQRGGKPALTFTNSLFTPAFFVFALIKDNALGFYLSNFINVLIGLIGMYLFLRLFLNQISSLFGAFIFMFSGFNAAWFFWAHIDTAIWTPWILFTVYQYSHTQKKKYLPFVALSMIMLNLGGFPMIAVMTYMTLAIMVSIYLISIQASWHKWIQTILYLLLYTLIAVMIALPFIYPLVELLEWMGGVGYRHGGAGFKLDAFELFINPNFYGNPRVETTFYVGILPVIFLFLALIFSTFRPRFIAIFGLVLFLFSITIAFTLISPEIIHKIPTLNSSLLTRFGFLIGLSLAIVSAYVLQHIMTKFHDKKWIYPLIILLFSIQIFDQKQLFNSFNDAVPNSAFYPQTTSIQYVQQNTTAFQYVMADQGYLIAGTLGAYGLNNWYAHSFHTPAEKELLSTLVNNAFRTPTSAMFTFSQINIHSPYLNYLGIKYILTTTFAVEKSIPIGVNSKEQIPSPFLSTKPMIQTFQVAEDKHIDSISLLMATYGKKHASSNIELVLMQKDKAIASSIVNKNMIIDNQWIPFKFKKMLHLSKGKYSISVKMLDGTNRQALAIWANTNISKEGLVIDGKELNISLKMGWSKQVNLGKKFKIHSLEPKIHIIENLDIKGEAYFLKTLHTTEATNYNNIQTNILSNTKIEILYNNHAKGWIILPMRSYPGWKITVNNKEVDANIFLGMLPAIKVNGKSNILFTYSPDYNIYTYLLSIFSIFFILLSMFKFRKKD